MLHLYIIVLMSSTHLKLTFVSVHSCLDMKSNRRKVKDVFDETWYYHHRQSFTGQAIFLSLLFAIINPKPITILNHVLMMPSTVQVVNIASTLLTFPSAAAWVLLWGSWLPVFHQGFPSSTPAYQSACSSDSHQPPSRWAGTVCWGPAGESPCQQFLVIKVRKKKIVGKISRVCMDVFVCRCKEVPA